MGEEGTIVAPRASRKLCNVRIDELAKPSKRLVLSVWQNYAYLFTPVRRDALKVLVQELYAMTPEETSKYFEEINKVLKKLAARERLKQSLLKRYKEKVWRTERNRAYDKFEKLLSKGMLYACTHPVPVLVSLRVRNVANVILEQLCDLRGLKIPERTNSDRQARFLINFSDWLAIAIEHIYYIIQVRKNQEFDLIDKEIRARDRADKKAHNTKSRNSHDG